MPSQSQSQENSSQEIDRVCTYCQISTFTKKVGKCSMIKDFLKERCPEKYQDSDVICEGCAKKAAKAQRKAARNASRLSSTASICTQSSTDTIDKQVLATPEYMRQQSQSLSHSQSALRQSQTVNVLDYYLERFAASQNSPSQRLEAPGATSTQRTPEIPTNTPSEDAGSDNDDDIYLNNLVLPVRGAVVEKAKKRQRISQQASEPVQKRVALNDVNNVSSSSSDKSAEKSRHRLSSSQSSSFSPMLRRRPNIPQIPEELSESEAESISRNVLQQMQDDAVKLIPVRLPNNRRVLGG